MPVLVLLAEPGITEPFTLMAAIAEWLIGRITAAAEVGLVTGLQGAAIGALDGGGAGDLKWAVSKDINCYFRFAHGAILHH
jgi:hypothetical protein